MMDLFIRIDCDGTNGTFSRGFHFMHLNSSNNLLPKTEELWFIANLTHAAVIGISENVKGINENVKRI